MATTTYTPSPAVQERMREMREKEAREKEVEAKLNQGKLEMEAKLKQEKLEQARRFVESAAVDWEANVLFELEKNPRLGYTALPMSVHPANMIFSLHKRCDNRNRNCRHHILECFNQLLADRPNYESIVMAIQNGMVEKDLPQEFTVVNERARIRLRVLIGILQVRKEEACTEAAEKARVEAAERARGEAEKAAVTAAWIEEHRIRMNARVAPSLADCQTVMHNYTDYKAPETLYMMYKVSGDGKGRLDVRRLTMDQIQEAFVKPSMCDFSSSHGPAPPISVPESWIDHYDTGKTPFLTVCPVCKKQPRMYPTGHVECIEHYKWDAATNTHSKWVKYPPPEPRIGLALMQMAPYPRPDGYYVSWDPKDPDGAIAAKKQKDRDIAKIDEEIARLQEMKRLNVI